MFVGRVVGFHWSFVLLMLHDFATCLVLFAGCRDARRGAWGRIVAVASCCSTVLIGWFDLLMKLHESKHGKTLFQSQD